MLPFTSVARVWPFWLVVGRCRVRFVCLFVFFIFIFFIFRISVVEKGGGADPSPLDPPLIKAPDKAF